MILSERTYIGIDPTASRTPITFAVLDTECNLLILETGDMEDVLSLFSDGLDYFVGVNGPPNPNVGLVRSQMEKQGLLPGQMRGSDMRMVEYLLREKNIIITPTPAKEQYCPEWMQICFNIYKKLDAESFKPYPTENARRQWLETHPHAAFCALLEQQPLTKPTLEGRLQRQLVLHEASVGIRNPMEYFEEITRYKLIKGIFPFEKIYTPEKLDALAAAYTAYLAANKPEKVIIVGSTGEGRIVLPVSKLKERYD